MFAENGVFVPVIMLGVIMAGGIFTSADSDYSIDELASQLKDAAPRFFIADGSKFNVATEAAAIAGIDEGQIFAFDESPLDESSRADEGVRHWQHLIASVEEGEGFAWREYKSREEANQTAAIVYSSGTSGISKGIEVSHFNYVACCTQNNFGASLQPARSEEYKKSRSLCVTGMHRIMAQTRFAVMHPQGRWGTGYIMPKFDYQSMVDNIDKYQITIIFIGPAILETITRDPLVRNGSRSFRSLRTMRLGGARVNPNLCGDFVRMLNASDEKAKLGVDNIWGMTE